MDNSLADALTGQATMAGLLIKRFRGRIDAYLLQLHDGSYICVKEPLTPELVRRHLAGEVTVGSYMMVNGKFSLISPERARLIDKGFEAILGVNNNKFNYGITLW